jgi:hypothetical protein
VTRYHVEIDVDGVLTNVSPIFYATRTGAQAKVVERIERVSRQYPTILWGYPDEDHVVGLLPSGKVVTIAVIATEHDS